MIVHDLTRLVVPLAALPGLDLTGLRLLYGPNVERATMAVSLSDASTRDRIARWLAGRAGPGHRALEVGCTAPSWWCSADGWWVLTGAHGFTSRWRGNDINGLGGLVPALQDLDPRDKRRVPDGSRYVDALALALVATHVAGDSDRVRE